jgi:hypothetical protein
MKQLVCSLLFSLFAVFATSASAQANRSGTVKSLSGPVQLVRGAQVSALTVGDAIQAGDRIETGDQASLSMSMIDGTRMTVGANSQALVETFHFDGTTQEGGLLMRVYQGTLRMVTGLIAKTNPQAVSVVTPTSVVGIRGTDFIVQVAGH